MSPDSSQTLNSSPMTRTLMRFAAATFVALLSQGLSAQAPAIRHLQYSGTLVTASQSDDSDDVLRRFDVDVLRTLQGTTFRVDEDRRNGVPWPDSFGRIGPGVPEGSVEPHLVYEYDTVPYVISLPPLLVTLPEAIEAESEWSSGAWQLVAGESVTIDGIPMWKLDATERRGRRQSLIVEAATGLLWQADADVFMGQGDRFRLTLKRMFDRSIEAAVSERTIEAQGELLAVQELLKRRPDSFLRELSERQVEEVAGRFDRIESLAGGTPWEPLSKWIADDLVQQVQRQSVAADRAAKLMGSELPDFELTVAGGTALTRADIAGQTVLLHFWDYRDSPLSEPYGQTGYLEFLFNQQKGANIRVIGISTNPELLADDTRARGLRSIRKLAEFMNLSYPIGFDDGSLLKSLGDPRSSRGQLPLWVIVAKDGKIRHYHAGPYEVDASRGLSQLEAALRAAAENTP
jgi:peroxiredoxin